MQSLSLCWLDVYIVYIFSALIKIIYRLGYISYLRNVITAYLNIIQVGDGGILQRLSRFDQGFDVNVCW